jgi:hypothetical protein
MWSKYKWTNMSEVDGGSAADRNQAVNTWYSKTNQANKLLKSSMFLYHYWTGAVEDVHIVNEYASVEDATEAIRLLAKFVKQPFLMMKKEELLGTINQNTLRIITKIFIFLKITWLLKRKEVVDLETQLL